MTKGEIGEEIVWELCQKFMRGHRGLLYHSYEYPVDRNLEGNIKWKENQPYVENTGSITEIDVLLVTPFKIYALEVKSYKQQGSGITVTSEKLKGVSSTDKNPLHQNEMHLRHLYPRIAGAIPRGDTKYLQPVVIFTDKAKVKDVRKNKQEKQENMIAIPNTLIKLLKNTCKPVSEDEMLDLDFVEHTLDQLGSYKQKKKF